MLETATSPRSPAMAGAKDAAAAPWTDAEMTRSAITATKWATSPVTAQREDKVTEIEKENPADPEAEVAEDLAADPIPADPDPEAAPTAVIEKIRDVVQTKKIAREA